MKKSQILKIIIDNLKTIFYALIIALIIRSLFFQPFYIPSSSMEPNLLIGDRIFVSKYSYGISKHSFPFSPNVSNKRFFSKYPKRGDLVVFKTPADNRTDYIKRLIGLPGDTVQLIDGRLYVNDKLVNRKKTNIGQITKNNGSKINLIEYEEYIFKTKSYKIIESSDNDFFDNTIKFTVPMDNFFFMGDNRDNSKDSRASEVGFVPKINLIGKAQIIFFSHNGSARFYEFWKWHNLIRFSRIGKKIE